MQTDRQIADQAIESLLHSINHADGRDVMRSSAFVCLGDALDLRDAGNHEAAARRARKGLTYYGIHA